MEAIKKSGGPIKVEAIVETLIIDYIYYTPDIAKEPIIIQSKDDVISAYKSLPARDKRSILDAYTENFGKYGVELKMRAVCIACGNEDTVDVNLTDNFFRMVYTS